MKASLAQQRIKIKPSAQIVLFMTLQMDVNEWSAGFSMESLTDSPDWRLIKTSICFFHIHSQCKAAVKPQIHSLPIFPQRIVWAGSLVMNCLLPPRHFVLHCTQFIPIESYWRRKTKALWANSHFTSLLALPGLTSKDILYYWLQSYNCLQSADLFL